MVGEDFVVVNDGPWVAGTTTVFDVAFTGAPPGAVPPADAVLSYWLALRSARVTVCVAEHEMMAPGARVAAGDEGAQLPREAAASATATLASVTLPVFVTVTWYMMTLPTAV